VAWICFQGSAESPWRLPSGSGQSPIVSVTDTLNRFYFRECRKVVSLSHRYGMMLELFPETTFKEWLISSSEDFPARTFHPQDAELAWKASEADYFSRSCAWPTKSSPSSFSLKMSPQSGHADSTELGKNWPPAGMIADGVCYPLSTWERRIKGSDGFVLLATPTATGNQDFASMQKWPSCRAMIPTPGAQDAKHRGTINTGLDRLKRGKQITLDQHVQLWPTPRASDSTHGGPNSRGSKGDLNLPAAVHHWPTPTARDYKDGANVANVPPNGLLGRVVEPSPARGSLTPEFCEWLMAYPKGWTVLNASGTAWFRSKSAKRSAVSCSDELKVVPA
jgi:hypothetical protein